MTALIAQADLGDYTHDYTAAAAQDYLKFVPNADSEVLARIAAIHADYGGLSAVTAEYRLLQVFGFYHLLSSIACHRSCSLF